MSVCPTCGTTYPAHVRLCPADGTVVSAEPETDPRLGMLLAGKYRLDAVAGRGGMGTVYRATHVMLGKTVAVKLINRELAPSPEFVERFQREARAAARLDHPNIASVYDLGQTDDGTLFIAMEFIDGSSLKDVIQTAGPLPAARIVSLTGQIAAALAAAHARNIIHRDLKPQNVCITRDETGREVAKLLDFGIAKSFGDDATQVTATGLALGTPQYMSPEQTTGQPLDGRSDLYSLGVIVYEMLTGVVPFDAKSAPAVLVKHVNEVPEPPSRRRPDVTIPAELEALALRCLEKDPARRFPDAQAVRAALDAVSAEAPTVPVVVPIPISPAAGSEEETVRHEATRPEPSSVGSRAADAPDDQVESRAVPPAPVPPPVPAAVNEQPIRETRSFSTGSALSLVVVVVLLIGSVGFAAYLTGYFSRPPTEATGPAAEPSAAEPVTEPGPTADSVPTVSPAETPGETDAGMAAPAVPPPTPPPARTEPAVTRPADPAPAQTVPEAVTPPPAEPQRPEHPSVRFGCEGPAEVCLELQSALDQQLGGASMPSVVDADRANLLVDAVVTAGTPRAQDLFGQRVVVQPYTVAFAGVDRESSERVPLPAPTSFSLDERVGRQRLTEQSRLMAMAVVERLKAYWASKR